MDIKKVEKYGMVFFCEPIDPEMCEGCFKPDADGFCTVYEKPSAWKRKGGCPVKIDKEIQVKGPKKGKKMNPLKASKRKYRR